MDKTKIVTNAINILMKYENIASVISSNTLEEKWIKKLNTNCGTFLLNSDAVLNLLKLGWGLSNNSNENYEAILYNLNKYLELITNTNSIIISNYAEKLVNIEGFHIFSTLSELALANYYFLKGFEVDYFHPFTLLYNNKVKKNRDVDLKLVNNGENYLIEVYMPTYTPDFDDAYSDSPLIEISDIKNHLLIKLNKKFDLKEHPEIVGIDKPLYLAVNISYDSKLLSQVHPPLNFSVESNNIFMKYQVIFKNKIGSIVKEIPFLSDILLFETDFCVKDCEVILYNSITL